ncbi:MAG TPA: MerR family transcriptional regulator [Acidimicrobiaceae bacterium]|nr:MerR family transcriptional regulator [Acidimicrobiaceae bacterium]HCV34013.1 MerR family transcriptional regulator [Acidimicrobiaceae bacterium]|tara:strand:+ start:339 stop:752 length:414 start_codon:yes stop_codon:yes gene_type:complete
MDEFKMGEAAQLLGISIDTVRRWADAGRLATGRTAGGHRMVAGVELARLAQELAEAGPGADPSSGGSGASLSARNRFSGLVTRVVRDGVMAQVEIQAGPHRVVSLLSAEAVEELGLEPGVLAVAAVKATNVVVERPR